MSSIGKVFLRLGVQDEATKKIGGIFKGISGQMARFSATIGAMSFIKDGIKAASDFQENWSIVTAAVGKNVQDSFMNTFSELRRTSKDQFSDMAATLIGIMKQKGLSDETISLLGPEVMKRLEDTASTFNATSDHMVEAFSSMMAGQSKPIKMLTKDAVIPLVENLDKLAMADYGIRFEKLAPDEQVLTRIKFFMDATGKYPNLIGNSAKTIGTFKGRLDEMKKSLKDTAATAMTTFAPVLSNIMKIFTGLFKIIGKNIEVFNVLLGMWAGFKVARSLYSGIKSMIALYTALMAAKAAASGGILGPALAAAAVAGLGVVIGGLIGGLAFGGGGSSSGSSAATTQATQSLQVNVNVNPLSGQSQATSNGRNINTQNNFGRGGS